MNGQEDNIRLLSQRRKMVLGDHFPFVIVHSRFKTISTSQQFTLNELHVKARESTSQYNEKDQKTRKDIVNTGVQELWQSFTTNSIKKLSSYLQAGMQKGVIIDFNAAMHKYKYQGLFKDSNGKNE